MIIITDHPRPYPDLIQILVSGSRLGPRSGSGFLNTRLGAEHQTSAQKQDDKTPLQQDAVTGQ